MQWRRYCANAPLRCSPYYSRYSCKSIENLEITRKTCSTVFFMFLLAVSGSMASSKVATWRKIGKKASIPAALQASASSVTLPANARTGFPYFYASFATPIGAFPITVCPSRRPSPVMTISPSWIAFSILISSSTMLIPGSNWP